MGIGATPDCGATWALPRLLGTRRALEIALLSQPIGAEDALRIGLINRVVPPQELEAETTKIAAKLAAGPAYAFARTKGLMRNSFDRTLDEQLALERDSFAACATTADFAEGLDAFFARRKPRFSGGTVCGVMNHSPRSTGRAGAASAPSVLLRDRRDRLNSGTRRGLAYFVLMRASHLLVHLLRLSSPRCRR